ncbi:hypothetical protein GZ212_13100 [Mangrovimonas sp. CR14]|uniref:hypothetical protein n=1 Tax=Mangrovimonas sp. CR14 TaxID=2706120 RepID=UPI0014222BF9|nr:hypothetical protein [Mangrovimonas sp. CR14]NIK93094.1 hypothetical protein [Mangrovimonas sp. CR14]
MKNSHKLYQVLSMFETENVEIKVLKQYFTPIYLADQIHSLENSGLIEVDWKKKQIKQTGMNLASLVKKKEEISKFERTRPKSLNDKKIEVNEPYLKIKGGKGLEDGV